MTSRFSEALVYADRLHADQRRKGGGVPYIGHLLSVAGLVIEAGGGESESIAALLHDAAEDHGGESRLAEINELFGSEVAGIVRACSDSLESPKPSWRVRKERYVAGLQNVPDGAVLVSMADKLDNSRAILRDLNAVGEAVWDRFGVSEPKEHLWYFDSLLAVYRVRSNSWMVEALGDTIEAIRQAAEAQDALSIGRLREVERSLSAGRIWLQREEAQVAGERMMLSPGDPGDDWDYENNAAMERLFARTRQTLETLEAEREINVDELVRMRRVRSR